MNLNGHVCLCGHGHLILDKMDWHSSIKGFKAYLQLERSLAANTVEAYIRDLTKLVRYLEISESDSRPVNIESEELLAFVLYLNDLGIGANSQARILSSLRAFFKYLLVEDIIDKNPAELVEGPRLKRKLPEVLTFEEIQAMLNSIDLSLPHGVRNRAMLEILYACGLRVSELLNLKVNNLFLDIGFIKVIGKGNKERLVPIGQEAAKHIQLYWEGNRRGQMNVAKGHENILFLNRRGKQLSRVMAFMIVKEAAERAGLKKNVSPHTFRHSFATHLVEGGADLRAVQEMLGHESIMTTEIYTHLDTNYLKETILMHHPLNKKRQDGE